MPSGLYCKVGCCLGLSRLRCVFECYVLFLVYVCDWCVDDCVLKSELSRVVSTPQVLDDVMMMSLYDQCIQRSLSYSVLLEVHLWHCLRVGLGHSRQD